MVAQQLPKWFLVAFFVMIVFIVSVTANAFLQEWVKTKFKSAKKGTRFEDRGEKPWVDRFIESQDKASEIASSQISMLASLNTSQKELVEAQRLLAQMLIERAPVLEEMQRILSFYDENSLIGKYLLTKIKAEEKKRK